MFKKIVFGLPVLVMLAAAGPALAQTSAAKNELVVKILQLQRPAIEGLATMMAQQSVQQMVQGAGVHLQTRIPPDKRQEVAKEIQADLKKYGDEVVPLLRERAVKLAPVSLGTLLEEKFSEDELRELIKLFESPIGRKYGQLNSEWQKTLAEKLATDARPTVEPKIKALEQSIAKRLGIQPAAAAPAKPASK